MYASIFRLMVLCIAFTAAGPLSSSAQQSETQGALRPGDVIRLSISIDPNIGGDFTIDETGNVSLPLLGTRSAVGVPANELRRQILSEYTAQFQNTAIQVSVLRRISVLGQVRNPGLYHVDTTMTVGDVIAQAGGPTGTGKTEEVRIIRNGQEIRADLSPSETLPPELRSGDQIIVPERNWFARNGRWLLGAGVAITTVIIRQVY